MKLSSSSQSRVHSPQSTVDGRQSTDNSSETIVDRQQFVVASLWAIVVSRSWQWTMDRGLSTVDCEPSTVVSRSCLWTVDCGLWTIWTIGKKNRGLNRLWATSVWMILLACLSSCGTYTFSGVAIDDSKVKTISIDNFYNDSGGGPPNMSQLFTEQIKDYYQQNTRLALVPENGDLQLEGAITRYEFVPVAARASGSSEVADVASEMRLNITVEATYINTTDDQYDFENRDFTFFADFDADRDPASVENELIDQIFEQIIFDIFTASVANW